MQEERNEVQLSFYNAFTKAIFGKSVSDLEKTVKSTERKWKLSEQKRKQEEQKRKQEEQKKIDIIINLHIEKGMSVKDIADVFDEDEKYIKKVIEQAKKN